MRTRKRIIGLAVGTAVGVGATASPAGAVVMSQFTWGSNPNVAAPASANVVGFWQEILISATNVYTCPPGNFGADGVFGTHTTGATKGFQQTLGVTKDGVVGPNTWNHAMNYVPPQHAAALVNNGNGHYAYYTGGDYSADLFYGSSTYGWKFEEFAQGKDFTTDYSVNGIGSSFDQFVC